ncbi:MAG TPA: hypothetical protein VLT84_03890 [Acidobacteriota bacterium]|nr:hypothetical protein [Acidobacteriota bacterium]
MIPGAAGALPEPARGTTRRRGAAAAPFVAALAALAAAVTAGAAPVELLRTGTFRAFEVTSKNGQVWYGVFDSSGTVIARPSVVLVTPARDASRDSAGSATGTRVSILGGGAPLFLVRGIERLRPGIVPTLIRKPRALRPGEIVFLPLHATARYRLHAEAPPAPDPSLPRGYRLSLERMGLVAEGSRVVFESSRPGVPPPIVWAGDLDRDDRIDLLMETGGGERASEWNLYLSDPARGEEMVRQVATLRSEGR